MVRANISNPIKEAVTLMDNVNLLEGEVEKERYIESARIINEDIISKAKDLRDRGVLSEDTYENMDKQLTRLIDKLDSSLKDKNDVMSMVHNVKDIVQYDVTDDVAYYIDNEV